MVRGRSGFRSWGDAQPRLLALGLLALATCNPMEEGARRSRRPGNEIALLSGALELPPAAETLTAQGAALLDDGTILIAGGRHSDGKASVAAQVYDPKAQTFTAVGKLTVARAGAAV